MRVWSSARPSRDIACLSLMKTFSLIPWENMSGMYSKGHHAGLGNVQLNLCFYPQGPEGAKLQIGWVPEIRGNCGVNASNLQHWAPCP